MATVPQLQALGWIAGHAAHAFFQRQHVFFAHINAEHASERAVASRMRRGLAEYRDLAVGADHRVGRSQDSYDILLVDGVIDGRATAFGLQVDGGVGGVFEESASAPRDRVISARLLPARLRSKEQLAMTTFFGSPPPRSNLMFSTIDGLDAVALGRRGEAFQRGFLAAFKRPLRKQR